MLRICLKSRKLDRHTLAAETWLDPFADWRGATQSQRLFRSKPGAWYSARSLAAISKHVGRNRTPPLSRKIRLTQSERSAEQWLAEAERLTGAMFGRRSGSAFEQVRCHYAHYRQAFNCFLDRGDTDQAVRLVACLRDYWWASELFAEGEEWIAHLVRLPELPTTLHAAVLDQAGALAFAQAEFSRARSHFEASVRFRRVSGSKLLLALALNHLAAATRWGTSEADNALGLYRESLAVAEEAQDRLLIAAALMPVGTLAIERGDLAEAESLLRQGLAIYVDLELTTSYPLALEQFAALAAAGGQSVRALQLAGAGAAWRTILDTYQTPYVAWNAGYVARARDTLSPADARRAWAAGQAMPLDQAISFALEPARSLPPVTQ